MQQTAYAKLNLFLHVTGRQRDGYHTLQSLVAFLDMGDGLTISDNIPPTPYPSKHYYSDLDLTLHVDSTVVLDEGFFANNLIYKAAKSLAEYSDAHNVGAIRPTHVTLEKHIPIGAGLGGGSSDAAAAMHLLNQYWQMHVSASKLAGIASALGSDIAACLTPNAQWMSGTGNALAPADIKAELWAVVVFPEVHLPAGNVYQALDISQLSAAPHAKFGVFKTDSAEGLLDYLADTRNDLTPPAASIAAEVKEVLDSLAALQKVKLTRMSGSGSACFALFTSEIDAQAAADKLAAERPGWWVHCTSLIL